MSKARARKQRKRARKGADNGTSNEESTASAPEDYWFSKSTEARAEKFKALKLELLGPFLFGQSTLCEHAVRLFISENVIEEGATALPVFFARNKWSTVRHIVSLVELTLERLEVDDEYQMTLLKHPPPANQDAELFSKILLSDKLRGTSPSTLKRMLIAIKSHVIDFAERAQRSGTGQELSSTLIDKEQLITPVKDRGNSNFKQERFKAAIGDYTTAIKLCPYNSILYCNRALCYLRNVEYWYACLDSYRAIVLRPGWEKAYYRCSEALAKLGEPEMALRINKEGIRECRELEDLSKQSADLGGNSSHKEQPHHDQVSSESNISGKASPPGSETAKAKSSDKPVPTESTKVKESVPRSKKSQPKKPFTSFETLTCPIVSSEQLSCNDLRNLSKKVQLNYFHPSAYFTHGYEWEKLETPPKPPFAPKTNMEAIKEPMETEFDEIWCPLIADSADKLGLAPVLSQ